MNFAYRVSIDGFEFDHECTYHTTEKLQDGTTRRVYPRFHNSDGLVELNLIAEARPGARVHKVVLSFTNQASHPVRISKAQVGLAFESAGMGVHYFSSDWGSEFSPRFQNVIGEFSFGSVAGRSSKGFIPFAQVDGGAEQYALALGWSGNWRCTAFPWPQAYCVFKQWTHCCIMGLSGDGFFYDIPSGGTFESPAVYIAEGENAEATSAELRRYFRLYLSRINELGFERLPMEFNTWWPYEDKLINEHVYQQNAEIAHSLGMRYAMMDAGWFGDDEDGQGWYEKRGDWDRINTIGFPSGMKAMCDNAKQIGILPGMWCEIEAVGRDAKLNNSHPQLIAERDGRSLNYVCFGSKAGREWAMGVADTILGGYGAKWIKFDFNLDPGMGCNRLDHDHGAGDGLRAHYLGYYQFLDELRAKYPDVVIENCASGGLRADIEMLSHTHVTHLSDPDHTEFHLQLFWGALSYLHQSSCLHFTWSETLQTHNLGITSPLTEDMPREKFDYIVRAALMGIPGFSWRLPNLAPWMIQRIKELGDFYDEISSDYILNGEVVRLTAQPLSLGRGERFPAFSFHAQNGSAMVFAFRLTGAPERQTVRLTKLNPDSYYAVQYEDSGKTMERTGAELMRDGLTFDGLSEEASEVVWITEVLA